MKSRFYKKLNSREHVSFVAVYNGRTVPEVASGAFRLLRRFYHWTAAFIINRYAWYEMMLLLYPLIGKKSIDDVSYVWNYAVAFNLKRGCSLWFEMMLFHLIWNNTFWFQMMFFRFLWKDAVPLGLKWCCFIWFEMMLFSLISKDDVPIDLK